MADFKVDQGKPSDMDTVRSISHLSDTIAFNLSHAGRHLEEARAHAVKMHKHIAKHGLLRKEALALAAKHDGVFSK